MKRRQSDPKLLQGGVVLFFSRLFNDSLFFPLSSLIFSHFLCSFSLFFEKKALLRVPEVTVTLLGITCRQLQAPPHQCSCCTAYFMRDKCRHDRSVFRHDCAVHSLIILDLYISVPIKKKNK